jgi:hypothetical protein
MIVPRWGLTLTTIADKIGSHHRVLTPLPPPEAEFLYLIGTKVLRVFLPAIHSHLY